MRTIGILLFDDVEVLDFAGPFEVFGVARTDDNPPQRLFQVVTVAETARPVQARNGLSINPHHTLATCPPLDLLLVPGGQGTRREIHNPVLVDWIKARAAQVDLLLSVCTGSFLLAKASLLDGLKATTYHTTFDTLAELAPTATLCPGERFVDNGHLIMSAGISAGIDMSLYVVGKLHGDAQATRTARHMEYEYWPRT